MLHGIRCIAIRRRDRPLNEIAAQSQVLEMKKREILVMRSRALVKLLGLDPLYVANEGKLLRGDSDAGDGFEAMRGDPTECKPKS